jgi:acyl carrier protein
MAHDEIMARLKPLLREAFPDADVETIRLDTTADDVIGWDSMAHVGLMAAIEDEFGIEFEPKEITGFEDVGGLVRLIALKSCNG